MSSRSAALIALFLALAYDLLIAMILTVALRVLSGRWWDYMLHVPLYFFPTIALFAILPSIIFSMSIYHRMLMPEVPALRQLLIWSAVSSIIIFAAVVLTLNASTGHRDLQYDLGLFLLLPPMLLSGLICGSLAHRLNSQITRYNTQDADAVISREDFDG